MLIAVGIATCGRPAVLRATLVHLSRQTRLADRIILCPAAAADLDPEGYADTGCAYEVIFARQGTCRQRNAIIESAADMDVIIFFDDDFLMTRHFIAATEMLFDQFHDVVMATGLVLGDGATNAGLTGDDAARLFARPHQAHAAPPISTRNGYGCNMAVRVAPVQAHHIRFDEALPLYGWLEDMDFSVRLGAFGRIVKSFQLQGVHLGIKQGRTSGVRLGYSQIANPLYMVGKRSMPLLPALRQILKNILMNTYKSPRPEAWIDRRGRLKGNAIAIRDLWRGRLAPARILEMK